MIPKAAVEKAIEGGWRPRHDSFAVVREEVVDGWGFQDRASEFITFWMPTGEIALDLLFWEALERATGKVARAMYLDFCAAVWDGATDKFWSDRMNI